MHYSAQLDETGLCKAVTETSAPLIGSLFVPLDFFDLSRLGKSWDGDAWSDQ
jgi:hypothetical protein